MTAMTDFPGGAAWLAAAEKLGDAPGKQRCEEPMSPASGQVCVTGLTGFLALHLARQLLEKGYIVMGTVRSESNEEKMAPVRALQEKFGADKLQIASGVDLLKPETFEAAVKDCVGVFHTASPYFWGAEDPITELCLPAKVGTESCLIACKAAGSVKRVVVTSSFAAVASIGLHPMDFQYSGKDWNLNSCPDDDGKFPEPIGIHGYKYSKAVAEKAAWDFAAAEDCPFDVATICPPTILGENLNKPKAVEDLNTSSATVLGILRGETDTKPHSAGWVDVADVARAHIVAYEAAEAGGRRFLCNADEAVTFTEFHQLLKEARPDCPVKCEPPAAGGGVKMGFDTSALKGFGFAFTPLSETLRVTAQSLADLGFLPAA